MENERDEVKDAKESERGSERKGGREREEKDARERDSVRKWRKRERNVKRE